MSAIKKYAGNSVFTGPQLTTQNCGAPVTGVSAVEHGDENHHVTVLTLVNIAVTLVKNATTSGGGGTKIYDFPEGLILPKGGSTNLTVTNALDKSFLFSLGTVAAGTDGTLTSTEANLLPSTAGTTSSGAGTVKALSTVSSPTPGAPIDGHATAVDMILNACLNADATGAEALTVNGTITYEWDYLGDN